jgi:hypothetical protein
MSTFMPAPSTSWMLAPSFTSRCTFPRSPSQVACRISGTMYRGVPEKMGHVLLHFYKNDVIKVLNAFGNARWFHCCV